MTGFDLHVHTCLCDGKNSPEEMVRAALDLNLKCIGFSAHSYTFFDESYCMSKEKIAVYIETIQNLKEKYKGKIRILCGIEQDYDSAEPTTDFDYVIGSVHYLKTRKGYAPIDENAEILRHTAEQCYGGDFYAMAEDYFAKVARVPDKTGADIIGHFDLISKFNEKTPMFDEANPRYKQAAERAIDTLVLKNACFEINTGAISRGYKTKPYPSPEQLRYIAQKGGRAILASDSHSADTLCYAFAEWNAFAKEIGLRIIE